MEITIDIKVIDEIREKFANAWKANHGGESGKPHILLGERSLAIMIPKALYQAELGLIKRSGSTRVLSRYLQILLEYIANQHLAFVEQQFNVKVETVFPLVDPRMGWITALYTFEEPILHSKGGSNASTR